MKYEVTIQGTLLTTLSNNKSLDCLDLACQCTEATIMLGADYAFQSVEARYVSGGDLTVTIRRRITKTEPPTVGEMQFEEQDAFEREIWTALCALPFSLQDCLENLRITEVTPLSED